MDCAITVRNIRVIACLFVCASIASLASCGDSPQADDKPDSASATASPREAKETKKNVPAQTPIAQTSPKWSVGRQLVYGLPWGSEKESEASLLTNVKESEATPDQRLVLALNDLAGWYRGQKKYDEAEKIYQRVIDLERRRMGSAQPDGGLTSNDLAVLYTEAGRFGEAEAAFKQLLGIGHDDWERGIRTEDEAVMFHNYGMLLQKMGRASEAKAMEDQADVIMHARQEAINKLGSDY